MRIKLTRDGDGAYIGRVGETTVIITNDAVCCFYADGSHFAYASSSLADALHYACDVMQVWRDDLRQITIDLGEEGAIIIRRARGYWYWTCGDHIGGEYATAGEAAFAAMREVQ